MDNSNSNPALVVAKRRDGLWGIYSGQLIAYVGTRSAAFKSERAAKVALDAANVGERLILVEADAGYSRTGKRVDARRA